ncbi:hypothetical protein ZIOFF_043156 [Zingiber officinale]|uniref:DUF1664 domain-containing protein n=1 Tax=Zingiber officinale TaxID=94328 RepID=A0A8J5KPP0_ZINOF|nr:hypothetical protein ZIOFF_043156 [Zingiber officinale]
MAMAMQTGMSSSKVLILVGAGLTGSIILRNGRISDVLSDLQHKNKSTSWSHGLVLMDGLALDSPYDDIYSVYRVLVCFECILNLEILALDASGLSSYIIPAAAVGTLGYCYMWWKGWSFSDVMFVTKKNMANAVANVSKQLEQVSASLAATKRHLTQRLENLDGKLDEQQEISKSIMNEVTLSLVGDVKTELSQIGFDIESLQQMLTGLEGKIGHLESKQDVTNAGIYYLCKFVGGVKDGLNVKFFQFALETAEKLPHSSVAPFSADKSIKGLQFLMENFKDGNADSPKFNPISQKDNQEKPLKPAILRSSTVHRSYPGGIALRTAGIAL